MLDFFTTAPDPAADLWREPDFFRRLSHGTICPVEDDICEPLITTTVVQITAWGYAHALHRVLTAPINDEEPDAERRGVEDYLEEVLANFLAPPTHCHHDWDCCGCRTGSFSVRHLGGAVFLCQSSTSRNY